MYGKYGAAKAIQENKQDEDRKQEEFIETFTSVRIFLVSISEKIKIMNYAILFILQNFHVFHYGMLVVK